MHSLHDYVPAWHGSTMRSSALWGERLGCKMGIAATTDSVTADERFDFWHEVICAAFVRLEAATLPSERSFRAEIASNDLGPVTLSRVRAEPHAVHRSPQLIRCEPRNEVLVSVQLRGSAVICQDDRQAVLRPGDFGLYDATRPYDLIMREQFEMLVLQFNRQFLVERCPSPEQLTALRISNDSPIATSVSTFLRSLEPIALAESNVASSRLAASALDLLGAALAERFGVDGSPNSQQATYFLRACSYVGAHASDPELTPAQIAEAVGVSLRYLHTIFAEHGTTISEYVIRRRLARCMDDLMSPGSAGRTITEIALGHGFKTLAHFTRRFTETYGSPPSEVRRNGFVGSTSRQLGTHAGNHVAGEPLE